MFFGINTVLMGILFAYLWLFFVPAYQQTTAYGTVQTISIIVTICMIGAYVASSLVILGKV